MNISEFAQAIEAISSIKELNKLMGRYLAGLGIHSYAFTYYDVYPSSQRPLRYSYVSPPLESWHHYFIASQFEDVDQTLQIAKKVAKPVLWDVYDQQKEAVNPKEIRLRQESIDHGIHKGVLIPVHGPGDDFGVLVVHQRKKETWLDQHPEYIHDCFLAAYYYYAKLAILLPPDSEVKEKFHLTDRELQCLELSAKGYLARDIAKILQITERTVNYHVQNLNKKMGVSNKHQAIYRAQQYGLLRG